MCGIFGVTINKESSFKTLFEEAFNILSILSESRGKEASGFAISTGKELRYLKTPFAALELVASGIFKNEVEKLTSSEVLYYAAIGHSRLVTNGYEQYNENNQPVIKNNNAVIHNGIIVNSNDLWKKFPSESKLSDLDSELIPTLLTYFFKQKENLAEAISSVYDEIYGMTSFASLPFDLHNLILATNNGSLYLVCSNDNSAFVFASEQFILSTLIENPKIKNHFSAKNITQISPNHSCLLNLIEQSIEIKKIQIPSSDFVGIERAKSIITSSEITEKVNNKPVYKNTSMEYREVELPKLFLHEFEERKNKILILKRCAKCILPETFPLISFDEKGVCNYCNNYTPLKFKGEKKLHEITEKLSLHKGFHNCLIPFSGGRDSSYALHYAKKELGLKPIAFSYDWGMLTDLARRNQSRMCGKLGVEHILISADIRKKRKYIKKNVLAWLKHPHLGTVPLFMAGDKQYFYYNNLLKKQNNLTLAIMGENPLEKTGFKTAFSGAQQENSGFMARHISNYNKLRMVLFYMKEFIVNPSYINSSVLDTFGAFVSLYGIKHDFINLYDYIPWEEEKIESTLLNQYDWEIDPETTTTWRIGDGTAPFYNYIYLMVAGFSENDTFRSNQIREGLLTRDVALMKSVNENTPRWKSIQWYCNTIGIDFERTIKIINGIKNRY